MENTNDEGHSRTFSEEPKAQQPAGSTSAAGSGHALILTVDDNPETQLLFRHFLSEFGDVVAAMSYGEALDRARKQPFDLILIDVKLSHEHTGIDLLHALRDALPYAAVPMIACTAYALPGDRDRLLKSGFTDYISKPFTRQQVVDVVRRYVPPSASTR